MIFKAKNKVFEISKKPLFMGILNITSDSFYDGGKFFRSDDALVQAEKMILEGADIIDVGGESSRPGSEPISIEEEISRVAPVIERISKNFDIPISVDTYKSEVAQTAIESGAVIVNDIYALRWQDGKMADVVAKHKAGVVLMHMQGTPQTMQKNPNYSDVVREILEFISQRVDFAKKSGIDFENILVDPGFGFGKTFNHNIEILKNLSVFSSLNRPILVGLSRKSFIGKILNDIPPSERLYGTLAASLIAYKNGARIFRVHDVKATKDFFETHITIEEYKDR